MLPTRESTDAWCKTMAIHVDNQKSLKTKQSDTLKRAGSQFIDADIGEESIEWYIWPLKLR